MGADIQNSLQIAGVPKVVPITDTPVRSELAQSLDSAYEAVNAAAKAFMARGNGKVAARLALVSMAVLAATSDEEWNKFYLHSSEEAAAKLYQAAVAAHAAIYLKLVNDNPKLDPASQDWQQSNAVCRCLKLAIDAADKAGVR